MLNLIHHLPTRYATRFVWPCVSQIILIPNVSACMRVLTTVHPIQADDYNLST